MEGRLGEAFFAENADARQGMQETHGTHGTFRKYGDYDSEDECTKEPSPLTT